MQTAGLCDDTEEMHVSLNLTESTDKNQTESPHQEFTVQIQWNSAWSLEAREAPSKKSKLVCVNAV